MSCLSKNTLSQLPAEVIAPSYDLDNTECGIVHIGPGAFHRAHQAYYTELALSYGGNWRIHGVSMRSATLKQKLAKQDNLYTLSVLDNEPSMQIIGAIKSLSVLATDRQEINEILCAPTTHIITLTVTEKGYCLNQHGDLDQAHKDIVHDLANPETPISAVGLLVQTLKTRRALGHSQLTIISCDNVADNGKKLKKAVVGFARLVDDSLGDWIEASIAFPCTMVDSITPATDDAFLTATNTNLGLEDQWPIQREAFTQWVVEDTFSGPRPAWDKVGVTFTNDVSFFEKAKLRILNGTHSTLAYVGSLCDKETVFEAISSPTIRSLIEKLLNTEIIPSLGDNSQIDLQAYAQEIIARYENKHIRHLLSQIAWDGSQKLPFRILDTVRDNIKLGLPFKLLSVPIAAWLVFLCKKSVNGEAITDPKADEFTALAKECEYVPSVFAEAVLNDTSIFAELSDFEQFKHLVLEHVKTLSQLSQEGFIQGLEDIL